QGQKAKVDDPCRHGDLLRFAGSGYRPEGCRIMTILAGDHLIGTRVRLRLPANCPLIRPSGTFSLGGKGTACAAAERAGPRGGERRSRSPCRGEGGLRSGPLIRPSGTFSPGGACWGGPLRLANDSPGRKVLGMVDPSVADDDKVGRAPCI